LSVNLFCTLFVFGRVVGPNIRIRTNTDNHIFGTAQIIIIIIIIIESPGSQTKLCTVDQCSVSLRCRISLRDESTAGRQEHIENIIYLKNKTMLIYNDWLI